MKEAKVPEKFHGAMLDATVRGLFELSWNQARDLIRRGKVTVDTVVLLDPLKKVRAGNTVVLDPAARKIRENALGKGAIVFIDKHIVVVEKPSGIATVPFDPDGMGASIAKREERGAAATLDAMVSAEIGGDVGVVHRIDKDTSGLVVFTRTWAAKKELMQAFRFHHVHRRYLAIVHGAAVGKTYETHLVPDRGDGLRGSVEHRRGRKNVLAGEQAQVAITHVEVVEALKGATVMACRLETGRTHQIRIHLSEDGHPLVGEKVYIRGFAGPEIRAPRLMLHAAELGFVHPINGRELKWTSPLPPDMAKVREAQHNLP